MFWNRLLCHLYFVTPHRYMPILYAFSEERTSKRKSELLITVGEIMPAGRVMNRTCCMITRYRYYIATRNDKFELVAHVFET